MEYTVVPNEEHQRDRYKEYLKKHLKISLDACGLALVDVHAKTNLLDVVDDRLPFYLIGEADLFIIMKDYGNSTMDHVPHFTGLRFLIDLKKDVSEKYEQRVSQGIAELIAVDLKSSAYPVLLLSDLNH
jgi:hypothetical protein